MNPKILNEVPVSMYDIKQELVKIKKRDTELNIRTTKTEEYLKNFASLSQDDLPTRCKAYLLGHLTSGVPTEAEVARELSLSRRSLQRRLSEFGLSFKAVVDATRHELALRYLDDPDKRVTEITFLLGFSEQSAFSRAFRRWQSQSPSAYRLARRSESQPARDGSAPSPTPRLP